MKTVWVLVAGDASARLLEKPRDGHLVEVAQIALRKTWAAGTPLTKRPSPAAPTARTPGDPEANRHYQAQEFAEKVALALEEFREQRRFDELHIVGSARMVGYLRPEMAPAVKAIVVSVLNEDLLHETAGELTRRLFS